MWWSASAGWAKLRKAGNAIRNIALSIPRSIRGVCEAKRTKTAMKIERIISIDPRTLLAGCR